MNNTLYATRHKGAHKHKMCMSACTHTHTHTHTQIDRERERERERGAMNLSSSKGSRAICDILLESSLSVMLQTQHPLSLQQRERGGKKRYVRLTT